MRFRNYILLLINILSSLIFKEVYSQSLWPENLIITPEKSQFQKTSTHQEVIDFIKNIEKQSLYIYSFPMGKSLEGKEIPVVICSKNWVKTPQEAKASGKTVLYIQGNIHAGEVEGKESIMMLMRDILIGQKQYWLDSLIVIFVPIYNTDANDKMAKGLRPSQEDSPLETGERESSEGYDLNRDGVKMDARETRFLFTQVINTYDPQIFVDLHTTNGTWHAYSLTWAPSFHSAGEYEPFNYSYNHMLPSITESMKTKHHLMTGPYGDFNLQEGWPLKDFYSYNHHPRYLVNQFGLRNRMAILSESFAHERFYQRINSTYSFLTEILEYSYNHASEIKQINAKAEKDCIQNIIEKAGEIKKGVRFQMAPLNELNNFLTYEYIPFENKNDSQIYIRTGKIVSYDHVKYHAKFIPVKEAIVPRAYIIPQGFDSIIDNLKMHGVQIKQLKQNENFGGDIYYIDSLVNEKAIFQKHHTSTVYGNFETTVQKFKKGDYYIDMAQPLSNLIFYLLEPESDDGLVHWNFFDSYIHQNLSSKKPLAYPVFKHYK